MSPTACLRDLGVLIRGVGYDPTADLRARRDRETVDLLRANNVQEGQIVQDDVQFVHRRRVRPDQYLRDQDVLICAANGSKRLVGKAAQIHSLSAQPMTFGAFMMVYRPEPAKVLPSFVAQLFHTKAYREWVEVLLAGSSINNLKPSDLGEFAFRLPSFAEQRSTSVALSDSDGLIGTLEHLITKRQVIMQGIMHELLTARTRLPGFGAPWKEVRLGDHVTYLKTVPLSRAQLDAASPLCYLHYGDIHTSSAIYLDAAVTPMPRASQLLAGNAGRLRIGDLVFADASEDPAGIGKSMEITSVPIEGAVPGLHTIAARFDKSVLADGFKAYLQFIPTFRGSLMRLAAGTKVLATTRSSISSVTLNLPDVDEQQAIAQVLIDCGEEIDALRSRLSKAKDVKQGMMQELLTGRTLPAIAEVAS